MATLEKGTSLSEVLTHLVNEVSQYVDRAAMFIVKGPSAIGWYARGVEPADVDQAGQRPPQRRHRAPQRQQLAPRDARRAWSTRRAPQQALARLGGNPQAVLAVPLILRDKLAAILYCDSAQEEVPPPVADLIEVLVLFAGKTIDMLSLAPKTAGRPRPRAAPVRAFDGPRPPRPRARPAARRRARRPPTRAARP